jgi:hypothetical protein
VFVKVPFIILYSSYCRFVDNRIIRVIIIIVVIRGL